MHLLSWQESLIFNCSLDWGPPTAAKLSQEKIYLLSMGSFFWRNFTLKKKKIYILFKDVLGKSTDATETIKQKWWVWTLVYTSKIWGNKLIKSTIWRDEKVGEEESTSPLLKQCVYATLVSMSSNWACLSRDNHAPRGLEALSWTLCCTTHLGCHYLMITILPVKPYCLIRGYEGDKTKRNWMNST